MIATWSKKYEQYLGHCILNYKKNFLTAYTFMNIQAAPIKFIEIETRSPIA